MALQTILKNICSFLEILDASRSPQVATWDATSLRNALEWAAYCQQIFSQSKGKSYSVDLDLEIRKLGEILTLRQNAQKPNNSSAADIELKMLEHSSNLLVTNLLSNVHLRRETLSMLMSEALPQQVSTHVKATSQDPNMLCLAQLLLRFLANALQEDAHPSERNKIQSLLMEKFGQTEQGQVVLMTSLLNLGSSGVRSANTCVKNVLENCLKLLVTQNDSSFISSSLLINVCNQSFEVYSHFVRHLVRCCEKLKPVYGTFPVSHPHQLVAWRPFPTPVHSSKLSASLGYEDARHCFAQLLCRGSPQVVSATDRLLRLLAGRQQASAIWSTLLSNLRPMKVTRS